MDAQLPRLSWGQRIGPRRALRGSAAAGRFAVGWTRWCYDQFVVLPAARFLPRRAALALAGVAGWIEALVPTESGRVARAEVRACGVDGSGVLRASARRLALPHRNLALLKRQRAAREHPREWMVTHVNGEEAFRWLANGRPFIITSGHFMEAALQVRATFLPRDTGVLANSLPGRSWSPQVMRRRQERLLSHGLLLHNILGNGRQDPGEVPFADQGESLPAMVERLSRPGSVQTIQFDAVWEKPSGLVRPFAGERKRRFAIGIARVSRLAQAPIVHYVPYMTGDGEIRVEWGPYIEPIPADADRDAEVAVINQLADALEAAIPRYHDQYRHPIGDERKWDEVEGRWK